MLPHGERSSLYLGIGPASLISRVSVLNGLFFAALYEGISNTIVQ